MAAVVKPVIVLRCVSVELVIVVLVGAGVMVLVFFGVVMVLGCCFSTTLLSLYCRC